MIDKGTVQRIMDAANIVDVVSDYVSLRKVGANYKGLCPFHNDHSPSFYVSPSRGICHCFVCGKGGNAAGFLMEIEQISYPEALKKLARKYSIEVQERELSPEEKQQQNDRESMFIVNEWAGKYFQDILHNDPDGQAVGMTYFRQRGFRDDMIAKFHLGFDPADRTRLAMQARKAGYNDEYLVKTGLCYRNDRGQLIDRFAGRVIFPWMGRSGRVVGFTARVLDSRTKGVSQKYVNSPDSEIYHKGSELYGIYQARTAIHKDDKVYLVEGQADVISMHQAGIENVVAGSGTALTMQQILLLKRYTNNITLIYDDDEAGHHAALKGTDEILTQGMNLRILLLPGGMDPDDFARSHTSDEIKSYISSHETDFIQFKCDILLKGVSDPVRRSEAINSVLRSVSLITEPVLRDTYVHDCAGIFQLSEKTLVDTMNRMIADRRTEMRRERERAANRMASAGALEDKAIAEAAAQAGSAAEAEAQPAAQSAVTAQPAAQNAAAGMSYGTAAGVRSTQPTAEDRVEWGIMQLIVRYGERIITVKDSSGNDVSLPVAQYIALDLGSDSLAFGNELYNTILKEANEHIGEPQFKAETYFTQHPDEHIAKLAVSLCVDRYQLSESLRVEMTPERLRDDTLRLVLTMRFEYVQREMGKLEARMSARPEPENIAELYDSYKKLMTLRNSIGKMLGKNII